MSLRSRLARLEAAVSRRVEARVKAAATPERPPITEDEVRRFLAGEDVPQLADCVDCREVFRDLADGKLGGPEYGSAGDYDDAA
jgi:hypothetical protein